MCKKVGNQAQQLRVQTLYGEDSWNQVRPSQQPSRPLLRDTYGSKIMVFATDIPHSVRASELAVFHKRLKNTQLHDAIMRSKGA